MSHDRRHGTHRNRLASPPGALQSARRIAFDQRLSSTELISEGNEISIRHGGVWSGPAIVLVVVGMIVFENRVSDVAAAFYLSEGKLTDAQKESRKVMLDLTTLLMNWATAVIGATAFFLKNVEKDTAIHKLDLILPFAVIPLSIISLFLGHLVIDKSGQILSLDQFPVNNEMVRCLGRFQYLAGLGATTLFGFHVFRFSWARILSHSR